MLVANPHFPWEGELRFHEAHLTLPGQLDVYGAAMTGMPIINIGFNEHVAWTHTVSPANHFTVYRLSLDPDDPTAYVYEGETRAMERREHTIDVLGDDGSVAPVSRVMYRSHHGPMLGASVLGWSTLQAFALRDANALAEALLSYSQSTDPASPHFADQTEPFSRKEWRPVLFAQEEIAADPDLVVKEVSGRR